MNHLTRDQIKKILVDQKKQNISRFYKDEIDVLIDEIVSLHQSGKIDESVVQMLFANIVLSITRDSVTEITNDLLLKNKNLFRSNGVNKVFLLNYSKESYA